MTTPSDISRDEGVFYADHDHAGYGRRLLAIIIDVSVLLIVGVLLWWLLIATMWYGLDRDPSSVFWIVWFAVVWGYLTILKPSPYRTFGYRLTGLKIVNLRGTRPSILQMTFRLLLWIFGPFNLLLDFLWLSVDTEHQTLRDCYSGTCVIRNDAQPIGTGPITLAYYTALTWTLTYPRVARRKLSDHDTKPESH